MRPRPHHHRAAHQSRRSTPIRAAAASLATVLVVTLAAVAGSSPAQAVGHVGLPAGESIINMFQWNWNSVARECNDFLGDSGYRYVQVSPPQEHIVRSSGEWWIHYQPVSYRVESRLGTRAEFQHMVDTCAANGLGVIVDAVINHMAAPTAPASGWAGSQYDRFSFPAVPYGHHDFHHHNNDCEVSNYFDRDDVQMCHLLGLNDLATGSGYVQDRVADYLNDLLGMGVVGFRVDASKHIDAGQLEQIVSRLDQPAYIVHEVIEGAGEPIRPEEYLGSGDVHEFRYARDLKRIFEQDHQHLAWLSTIGQPWGYLSGVHANVFVENHDTEREGSTLSYQQDTPYRLANVFLMGWHYGTPTQYSGYHFDSFNQGPPRNGDGTVADAHCGQHPWICQHRWNEFTEMAKFRQVVGASDVNNWWDNGANAIGFGRGEAGYVAINAESTGLTRTFQTALPAGAYCDVIDGGLQGGQCGGRTLQVDGAGRFTASLPAGSALALHAGARPDSGAPGCVEVTVTATTWWGQEVFITGDRPELGNWQPVPEAHLSPVNYPQWTGTVSIPAGTTFEYKYIKQNPDGHVEWESGGNRSATVPGQGCLSLQDSWRD